MGVLPGCLALLELGLLLRGMQDEQSNWEMMSKL